jgi:hypothetical protein
MAVLNNLAVVSVVVVGVLVMEKMRGDLLSCNLSSKLECEMRTMALRSLRVKASRPDKFDWLYKCSDDSSCYLHHPLILFPSQHLL